MVPTIDELMRQTRKELRCPAEFIKQQRHFHVFLNLKRAIESYNRDEAQAIIDDIREGYLDYCKGAGLDPEEDNRKKTPHYFVSGLWHKEVNE